MKIDATLLVPVFIDFVHKYIGKVEAAQVAQILETDLDDVSKSELVEKKLIHKFIKQNKELFAEPIKAQDEEMKSEKSEEQKKEESSESDDEESEKEEKVEPKKKKREEKKERKEE